MPVYLHLCTLMISKKEAGPYLPLLIQKYKAKESTWQEDGQLIAFARMNDDEFDIEALTEIGLRYDYKHASSPDFVIHQRYTGFLWKVPWISSNGIFAWHTMASHAEIKEAERISSLSMNAIGEYAEKGINLLQPIWFKANSDSE